MDVSDVTQRPVRRALISVYDKTGLSELAQGLHEAGVSMVSTGSTAVRIADAGVPVTKVEDLTGFPECLDGRVKTLHPRVHAGILADRRKPDHEQQLADLGVEPFELVVGNLYPFTQTVASGASPDECIEQIDIAGGFTLEQRQRLALDAFVHTGTYDVAVASWMGSVVAPDPAGTGFPAWVGATWDRASVLRYGENPHQRAALYTSGYGPRGLAQAEQLHGKEMSYNNYIDADAAHRAAYDQQDACVAIIKHANPCGIAIDGAGDAASAYRKAFECDPVSAFGGVVASNRTVTRGMAEAMGDVFTEVVVAPDFEDEALDLLREKKNVRLLRCAAVRPGESIETRSISGGMLMQVRDALQADGDSAKAWTLATGTAASDAVLGDLEFAWRACRSVKSNAILLAKDGASVGVGMGQVSRVDSATLAVMRAGADRARGSVAASDAFFPFPDGLQVLIDAGISAVVQPGGSVRDDEIVAAAEAAGVTMYLTGTRHFFH
jgi:phosphoribosylaminoimidazolecarboxamide formyltransferase/IMP cyclohydrolase